MKQINNNKNNKNNHYLNFFKRTGFTTQAKQTFKLRVKNSQFNQKARVHNCHKISFDDIRSMLVNVVEQKCSVNLLTEIIKASNNSKNSQKIIQLITDAQTKPMHSKEQSQLIQDAIKIWFNSDLNLRPGNGSTNQSIKANLDPNADPTPNKNHYRFSPISKDILNAAHKLNSDKKYRQYNHKKFTLYSPKSQEIWSSSFTSPLDIKKLTPDSRRKLTI